MSSSLGKRFDPASLL